MRAEYASILLAVVLTSVCWYLMMMVIVKEWADDRVLLLQRIKRLGQRIIDLNPAFDYELATEGTAIVIRHIEKETPDDN